MIIDPCNVLLNLARQIVMVIAIELSCNASCTPYELILSVDLTLRDMTLSNSKLMAYPAVQAFLKCIVFSNKDTSSFTSR